MAQKAPAAKSKASKPRTAQRAPRVAKPKPKAKAVKAKSPERVTPRPAAAKKAPVKPKAAAGSRPPVAKKANAKKAAALPRKAARAARPVPARRGSGHFDRQSLAAIEKKLRSQYDELLEQLHSIEEAAFHFSQSEMSGEVSYDEDYADAGSFTFEREKDLSIANNVQDLLDQVNRALAKIEEGTYGICESCGQPIDPARLRALPHVSLCIRCKKAEERR